MGRSLIKGGREENGKNIQDAATENKERCRELNQVVKSDSPFRTGEYKSQGMKFGVLLEPA